MFVFLADEVFNAALLPADWSNRLIEFFSEKLGIPTAEICEVELLNVSIDSRRGAPKLLVKTKITTLKVVPGVQPFTAEVADAGSIFPAFPDSPSLCRPIVVGTGPAGLAAAWYLATAGCRPLVIDRGGKAESRIADYRNFVQTGKLNPENNLLLGEGGAGAFSDGKLYTGTKDFRGQFLKKLFVRCGAPAEIMWRSRPHIGSDILPQVVTALRLEIESAGGTFLFNTGITDVLVRNGRCCGVLTAAGERLEAPAVFIAPGLGGRDLVRKLTEKIVFQLKPFQTGCRIVHPQRLIDRAMYHLPVRPAALGAAEYHLSTKKCRRPFSSFCMCPGGEVVNATAWEGHSITNGMSNFARDCEFANSCLITTVYPEEYRDLKVLFAEQERLERRCFAIGGGDYSLPAVDAAAFLKGGSQLSATGGCAMPLRAAELSGLFLPGVADGLKAAIMEFDRHIPGFLKYGRCLGVESFVSSPIRFQRNPETLESSLSGCYLPGEGCGAAGGIISAACDGLRCAQAALLGHKGLL